MTEDKILTKHPEGKRGVNISRAKYDAIRSFDPGMFEGEKRVDVHRSGCMCKRKTRRRV